MFLNPLTASAKHRLLLVAAIVGLSSMTGCFWRHHDDDDRRTRTDVYERRDGRPAGDYDRRDHDFNRDSSDRDRAERDRRDYRRD